MTLKEKIALHQLATDWMAYSRHLREYSAGQKRGQQDYDQGRAQGYENAAVTLRKRLKSLKS